MEEAPFVNCTDCCKFCTVFGCPKHVVATTTATNSTNNLEEVTDKEKTISNGNSKSE